MAYAADETKTLKEPARTYLAPPAIKSWHGLIGELRLGGGAHFTGHWPQ